MAEKTRFIFGKGAAEASLPSSWRAISDDTQMLEFVPDDYWSVPIKVDNRIFQTPIAITEKDIPQFFDRNVLVPRDAIARRDDGVYFAQYLNRIDDRTLFVAAFCRQIAETEARRVTLTYSKSEDAEFEQTILDSLDELAHATTITVEPRGPGDKLERLESRLVAPFYEVLFEVPWDWIYEWSKELELPLYYRDEKGTGTLQVQVDSYTMKESTSAEVERFYNLAIERMAPGLGHDLDAAIGSADDVEARLFKRIDPEYESSDGIEVSVKWTRFTLFSDAISIVNFDFLVSKEQYALPLVQKELEVLHQGIVRARVRPPKANPSLS